MVKHPASIEGYKGTFEELGRDLGLLRYDALLAVIHALSLELYRQMQEDAEGKRTKVARALAQLFVTVGSARRETFLLWKICRPHMQADLAENSEIKNGYLEY